MSIGSSTLGGTSKAHRAQLARNVQLLLLWVAESDGDVEVPELDFVAEQFPGPDGENADDLLAIIRSGELRPLESAIRFLAEESRELRVAFLDLAITMAMSDHRVAVTENYILRFFADALHLGEDILERRFKIISGVDLCEPGDPADPEWWEENPELGSQTESNGSDGMSLNEARAMLGVERDASMSEIESAYRKLSGMLLAKRVEASGPDAVTTARKRSRKLREAYDLLKG
ncbi:TerB family tellurite resistance protein [Elongatibacter sediminis]|uniref:TerB family tellurite resistance protein n=1 Tax=Elongatibacter sediminis TaxID=3119006 RepID=A0AAW9RI65_9GAMM